MNILNFFFNRDKKKSANIAKKRLHNNINLIKKKQYNNNFYKLSPEFEKDLTKTINKYIKNDSSILTIQLKQTKENLYISELKILILNNNKNNYYKNIKN